jgi:targeting protein for Xklp2
LRNAKIQEDSVTPLRPVGNTYYKEKEKEKENLIEHSIPSNACSSPEV